jgi:glycosyltransferase involved in cell wall biosynthesis
MEVSVIIAARNAEETLPRTLEALAGQDLDAGYEVVVVDDGSSDRTAHVASRGPGPVSVLRRRGCGPAAARNAGVAASRGRVLAFTDADCMPTRGWLRAGVAALARADLVQGAVRPDPGAELGPLDRTLWVTRETGLYELASLFVTRDWFDRVGRFEAWLRPEIGKDLAEDLWFGWRLRRAGGRTAFCPEALVHHEVFPRAAREFVAERRRLRYFPDIARKVPEIRRSMFFGRFFLLPRTAAFDAALAGSAMALALRSPVPLLAASPYCWIVARRRRPWRPARARVAAVELAADAVGLASLVRGSIRRRTLVL